MPAMVPLVENGSVALGLIAAIAISTSVSTTRRYVPTPGLRLLLIAVLTLYAVGCAAIVDGQLTAGVAAFAAGMLACAFGAWLSRGYGQGGPPRGGEPFDRPPPRRPDGPPEIDWDLFERELRDWARRHTPDVPTVGCERARLATARGDAIISPAIAPELSIWDPVVRA